MQDVNRYLCIMAAMSNWFLLLFFISSCVKSERFSCVHAVIKTESLLNVSAVNVAQNLYDTIKKQTNLENACLTMVDCLLDGWTSQCPANSV